MPNVDKAIRLLTFACTDKFVELNDIKKKEIIDSFFLLPRELKPNFFKNKTYDKIKIFFENINWRLKIKLGKFYNNKISKIKPDSNSNIEGADLIIVFSNGVSKNIELKFGSKTDRALGVKSFEQIVSINQKPFYFKNVFQSLKEAQKKYASHHYGDVAGLIKNLKYNFDTLVVELNELLKDNSIIVSSDELRRQLNCTGSATKGTEANQPDRFLISLRQIKYQEMPNMSGVWIIKSIHSSQDKDTARVSFIFENDFATVKFLVHWKNDLEFEGYTYPAKTGINTWCFNVWIKKKE